MAELACTDADARGAQSNLDDFGARYYSSSLGRWLSADWSAVPAPVPYANLTNPQTLNLYAMVRDNPETFADLDGHTEVEKQHQETNTADPVKPPETKGTTPQEQKPDQVQQVIQAQADAKRKAIAEQTRTPSEEDKKNALVKAGKMGDAGVKAALVVVSAEAAVAVAVVGGPAAVTAVLTGTQAVGAAAETYLPGGVATLNQVPDVIRGWRTAGGQAPGTIPQTPGGMLGAGDRAAYELIKSVW